MEISSILILLGMICVSAIVFVIAWKVSSSQFKNPEKAAMLVFDRDELSKVSSDPDSAAASKTRNFKAHSQLH